MKKIGLILFILTFLTTTVSAGSDGENALSKNQNGEVKDCFEGINRAFFAFNKWLDNVLIDQN